MKKDQTTTENKAETKVAAAKCTPVEPAKVVPEVKVIEESVSKVGNLLKEVRTQKGYKIVDIAKKLCIRRIYLEAIETSNYKEIPEFPYGIGFIRSYADYLGLNGGDIVQLYKDETEVNQASKNMYVLEPQAEATLPNRKYLLISLLGLLLVYILWSIYSNKSENEEVAVPVEVATVVEESGNLPLVVEDYAVNNEVPATPTENLPMIDTTLPAAVETAQVVVTNESFDNAPVAVAAPAEAAKPGSRVMIKVDRDTWVEVKDANKLYISKVLKAGDSYSVPSGAGMLLSVGRVEGVEILVDGKPTQVVSNNKKMGVALDSFLAPANH